SAMIAGMAPHAGYVYSGPCAAHLYSSLDPAVKRVIVLGVNHWARGHRASLSPWPIWRTPLGEVVIDQELSDSLETRVGFLKPDAPAHAQEHSIEVQLPFLERVLADFTFLPISLSHLSEEECAELGAAIADLCKAAADGKQKTLILASSDLSHYLSPKETERLDRMALDPVLAVDPPGLLRVVEEKNISMCGVLPTAVMLFAAAALGVKRARLLKHCHSGDVSPMRKVVGYASVAFEL
ncbi:MAG TPA: AmmeMemoRadiSam system protein B, partial [Candidatus Binatia bacterium]|nr:AmmeMemoRadiSam system protein B [Candidatus Binatia bacterium]